MTSEQAINRFLEIRSLWGSGEPLPIEQNVWRKELRKLDNALVGEAIERLYKQRGRLNFDSLLKLLPDFKRVYYALIPQEDKTRPWCPCCDGTGFISFEKYNGNDYVVPCHCKTGGLKDDNVCQNLHCQNPSRSTKLTFMAGFSVEFPWKVAGWRHCNYHPSITEAKHLHIQITTKNDRRAVGILARAQCVTKNVFDLVPPPKTPAVGVKALTRAIPAIKEIG